MPFTYCDAISLAFGSRSFEAREFAWKFGSLRPYRRLSELKIRGVVERVGPGRYRLLSPDERPDLRGAEATRVRHALLDSGLPMAWSGPTAVWVWTGGRYTVSPSVYLREFHINVPRIAVDRWRRFLRRGRISTDDRRRIGVRVELHPTRRFRAVRRRGEPVIPRSAVVSLIRAHPGIYANAEKLVER